MAKLIDKNNYHILKLNIIVYFNNNQKIKLEKLKYHLPISTTDLLENKLLCNC